MHEKKDPFFFNNFQKLILELSTFNLKQNSREKLKFKTLFSEF